MSLKGGVCYSAQTLKPRSILSDGVGCLAGVLGYHRASNTEGP